MSCIYGTIYIQFDLRIFDLQMTQIQIHRKPIRRFVFSVISVFYVYLANEPQYYERYEVEICCKMYGVLSFECHLKNKTLSFNPPKNITWFQIVSVLINYQYSDVYRGQILSTTILACPKGLATSPTSRRPRRTWSGSFDSWWTRNVVSSSAISLQSSTSWRSWRGDIRWKSWGYPPSRRKC